MKFREMILHLPTNDMSRISMNGFHIKIDKNGIVSEYDGENNYVGDYILNKDDIEAEDWELYKNILSDLYERAVRVCVKAANPEAYSDFIDLTKNYYNLNWFIDKWEDYKGED